MVTYLTIILLPRSVQSGAIAMLTGSLVGGWSALALDGRSPAALGFYVGAGAARESGLGLALGVLVALIVVVVMALVGGLEWSSEPGSWTGWLVGAVGALAFLALPAAAEEALLRGYPLQALSEAWGAPVALIVTSVAFGAAHLANPEVSLLGVVNIGAAGLLLGVVYLRTGSLWWATGVHLGWNWAHGYGADLPVSGLEVLDAPLYEGASRGAAWMGGGAFGPEGSVVTTVVVLAATLVFWRAPWLQPGSTALAADPIAALSIDRELQDEPSGSKGA